MFSYKVTGHKLIHNFVIHVLKGLFPQLLKWRQLLWLPISFQHTRPLLNSGIMKTRLYNFDPLKTHFYIVKLGFPGNTLLFYFIFLISAQNIDWGDSLEPPRRGGSNEYSQSMFWAETGKKYQNFNLKSSSYFVVVFCLFLWWIFQYLSIGVFSKWLLKSGLP